MSTKRWAVLWRRACRRIVAQRNASNNYGSRNRRSLTIRGQSDGRKLMAGHKGQKSGTGGSRNYWKAEKEFKRRFIMLAVKAEGGNYSKAAWRLGISRQLMMNHIKREHGRQRS